MILRAISIQYKLRFLEMHINKLALSITVEIAWLQELVKNQDSLR
jgi:hypothetical protein